MKYDNREKGAALLLALGFAALLLVLVMGFVTNALIERKVASTNADRTEAKSIAMSALNRAAAAMRYQIQYSINNFADSGIHRFDNIVSKSNDTSITSFPSNANEFVGLEDVFLPHTFNGTTHYGLKNGTDYYIYRYPLSNSHDYNENGNTVSSNAERQPQWQYVRQGYNTGAVIGRYLYAVLPDMGKIPATKFSSSAPASIENNGRNVNSFANFFTPFRTMYGGQNYFNVEQGFQHITNNASFPDMYSGQSAAEKENAYAFYALNMVEPLNSNSNWNTQFKYGSNTDDMFSLFDNSGNLNSSFPTTVAGLQNKILYLNKIDSDATVRNQIAANIIEAFKPGTGNVLSGDNNGNTDVFDNTTTYTGNRRTPYINEIEVKIAGLSGNVNTTDNGDGTKTITVSDLKANVEVLVELYDPYGAGLLGSSFSIEPLDYDFSLKFMPDNTSVNVSGTQTVSFTLTKDDTYTPSISNGFVSRLYKAEVSGGTLNFSYSSDFKIKAVIENFKANWAYKVDGGIVDFVKNLGGTEKSASREYGESEEYNVNGSSFSSTGNGIKYGSFQAIDARSNLDGSSSANPLQWNQPTAGVTTSNIGSANTGATVIDSRFIDPNNLNDFSLADFGLISRGESGKTLNIHSVGATDTNSINGTVNDISVTAAPASNPTPLADGGLLDQITTMVDANPQLIDINTRSVAVWRSLLSNIRGDVTAANPTPNYILNATQAENLARKISYNIRQNREFFKSRSGFIAVFNASLVAVNSIPATTSNITGSALSDREKQIIIGKILPLCKTEDYPEFIQVIVVAQKIKDRDGAGTLGTYEHGADQIVSEVRLLAKIRRRVNTAVTPHQITFEIVSIEELID